MPPEPAVADSLEVIEQMVAEAEGILGAAADRT
jgi:hypothetical protein